MKRRITVGWVKDEVAIEEESATGGRRALVLHPDELEKLIADLQEARRGAKEMGLLTGLKRDG